MLPSKPFTPQFLSDIVMIEQIAKKLGIKDPEYFSLLSHAEQWSVLKITAFMDKKFDILDGLKAWENQYKKEDQN